MRSIRLSKALSQGKVKVRTGRGVVGQVLLKFRNPDVRDRVITPFSLADNNKEESYIDLSKTYSAEQLMNSNLEDLVLNHDLELKAE